MEKRLWLVGGEGRRFCVLAGFDETRTPRQGKYAEFIEGEQVPRAGNFHGKSG
jgi:hypothetical protein